MSDYVSHADAEAQEICSAIEDRKWLVPPEDRLKYYREISTHCEDQIHEILENILR